MIQQIPTEKEELFKYPIDWAIVDRVSDFLGEFVQVLTRLYVVFDCGKQDGSMDLQKDRGVSWRIRTGNDGIHYEKIVESCFARVDSGGTTTCTGRRR